MSVRVRLTRVGSKKNAIWRVVVADQRSPRDGRFIEMIGHYNPQTEPSQIVIDEDRLQHWLERGAEPSNTVKKLMRAQTSGGTPTAVVEDPAPAADEPADGDQQAPEEAEPAAPEAVSAEEAEAASPGEPAPQGETESG